MSCQKRALTLSYHVKARIHLVYICFQQSSSDNIRYTRSSSRKWLVIFHCNVTSYMGSSNVPYQRTQYMWRSQCKHWRAYIPSGKIIMHNHPCAVHGVHTLNPSHCWGRKWQHTWKKGRLSPIPLNGPSPIGPIPQHLLNYPRPL